MDGWMDGIHLYHINLRYIHYSKMYQANDTKKEVEKDGCLKKCYLLLFVVGAASVSLKTSYITAFNNLLSAAAL